jgi:hypothetical protein
MWWDIFYLEKAFDCVDHSILLKKISYYGIKGVFSHFSQYFGPTNTSTVLFAGDTSVIINELNFNHLEEKLNLPLKLMNEWFKLNILSLNYDKTCCMKFAAKQDYTY